MSVRQGDMAGDGRGGEGCCVRHGCGGGEGGSGESLLDGERMGSPGVGAGRGGARRRDGTGSN